MDDSKETRLTLIARLRDYDDSIAWREFTDIYAPVVHGVIARSGLQYADAADVTQEVFRSVARSINGFRCDRARGSFRGWLMAVIRSRLADFFARTKKHPSGSGDTMVLSLLENMPDSNELADAWDDEYRRSVFEYATNKIRDSFQESTWTAFWQTAVEGQDSKKVAEELAMTPGAVYIAKCRVLAKIKETIERIDY